MPRPTTIHPIPDSVPASFTLLTAYCVYCENVMAPTNTNPKKTRNTPILSNKRMPPSPRMDGSEEEAFDTRETPRKCDGHSVGKDGEDAPDGI